jgi:phosphoribosyl 1,2-cyclic phosphate phosphodiesterase
VSEAVAVAAQIGAERTYLIHLTHETSHAELEGELPPGVQPAYDGLVVEI